MKYCSTRGKAAPVDAADAVLNGIAPDGGLYIMETLPETDYRKICMLAPKDISVEVLKAMLPGFSEEGLRRAVAAAYDGRFASKELTPLVRVGDSYVLELFHGPTCAFKDVALCLLPHLMNEAKRIAGRTENIMILTATSGDTGKAALSGFADVDGFGICVFYPDGGVSAVQRAQMVTQRGKNVAVCAVNGNFDTAQTGVKNIFAKVAADPALLPENTVPSSANSINIGRLAPQVMYYFKAYGDLVRAGGIMMGDSVDYAVPTGNFGDILAGYIAKRMGLPVGRLICASNSNDVLTDFIKTGVYDRRRRFYRTASPSMDILISSNLERLLYYETGSHEAVRSLMAELDSAGHYDVGADIGNRIRENFVPFSADDGETFRTIGRVYAKHGYLMDTHTAVAWRAGEECRGDRPLVVLSTASPFKFAGDVLSAIGGPRLGGFEALNALTDRTGIPVPQGLRGLDSAAELHRDVTEPGDMLSYVTEKAVEMPWER